MRYYGPGDKPMYMYPLTRTHLLWYCSGGWSQSPSGKSKRVTKQVNLTDDDKLHTHRLREGDSEEEAEFEATPRASKWEGGGKGGENQELHYLLPLKGKHGRLIQQEPTLIPTAQDSKTK